MGFGRVHWLWAVAILLAACSSARTSQPQPPDAGLSQPTTAGQFGFPTAGQPELIIPPPALGATCDPTRSVTSESSALIVREPAVLARFPLERVLRQLLETGEGKGTPTEMLQRMFDSENTRAGGAFADTPHCDTIGNPELGLLGPVDCPRAEGKLARSAGLLVDGDPDFFAPVALINRFDLISRFVTTCGEYRILYAKQSGRTKPDERVFLTVEGALRNTGGSLAGCRPIAELWAGLPSADATSVADRLERFFFVGEAGFKPVIHAEHFGLNTLSGCDYASCGQIRIGQGMQSPWDFRQFRLRGPMLGGQPGPALHFAPVPVTNSPRPELFDGVPARKDVARDFREPFVNEHVSTLSEAEVPRMHMLTDFDEDAMDSALAGAAQPNFAARAEGDVDFELRIQRELESPQVKERSGTCPDADPLTPTTILRRATAVTCAGCHAPDLLLAPDRALGCGQTQPKSLGTTHIDEYGALSEALTRVYLPHRAAVFNTYLQACDRAAVDRNLQPLRSNLIIECFAAGTPISMADGSYKAIEQVQVGDEVLAFDEGSRTLVPSRVERTAIRLDADSIITIDGALEATPNHPFYTARGLQRAETLELGDTLYAVRGAGAPLSTNHIHSLVRRSVSLVTYNIEVETHHNYFAGGFLVHDKP